MGLLAVEPQSEQPQPSLFVQSLCDDGKTVRIIKCPADLVSLKHLKLEVIAGRSGMIHQRTANPLPVPSWGHKYSSYLVLQERDESDDPPLLLEDPRLCNWQELL